MPSGIIMEAWRLSCCVASWRSSAGRVACLALGLMPLCAAAQTTTPPTGPPTAVPGEAVSFSVAIPAAGRDAGKLRYTVEPAAGVLLQGASTGTLTWTPGRTPDLPLKLQLVVPKKQPVGPFVAARVLLRWPDGQEQAVDVLVHVAPLPPGTSSKDMEAEVIPVPGAAAPGGVVKLMYAIFSYEDTDERVRLRVDAGPGWRLLDPDAVAQDILVEAWEVVEGELYVVVPEDAQIGSRQSVRLIVEVVGEAGEIEGRNFVAVARRGSARPGVPTLSGAMTAGLSQLGVAGLESRRETGAFELSSKFGKSSNFSFSYDQGLQTTLSNFRYEEQRTRVTGTLRHAGWDVSFGNYVSAQSTALTGPYVRGRGASIRRPNGRLVGELLVAQPNAIGGVAAGHVVRGRTGVRTSTVTLALSASDFGRPAGGYTTLSRIQTTVLDADTEERLEFERRLTSSDASNRVRGLGLETEFRPSRAHQVSVRAGGLWLSNASGTRAGGATGEAAYSLNTKPAMLNLRWRDAPPTVSGISIPGDELAADGSLRLAGELRLVARAYQNSTETVGADLFSRGEGGSVGMRYARGARRIELRGNYRESQFSTANVRRTVSVTAATAVGPVSLSGSADVGEQDTGRRVDRVAFYRTDLRWVKEVGTVSLGASHSESLGIGRQRVDLMTSLKLHDVELAGGAWATRGYSSGGRPGMWTSVGIPVGYDSLATFAIDYSPLTWTAAPSLRGSVSIRKRFTLPIPFMGAAVIPAPGARGSTRQP